MTDTHSAQRKSNDIGFANIPLMPRLAEQAAQDLARPTKAVYDGLRAIEAWFGQHGDPFSAVQPPEFTSAVSQHQDAIEKATSALSNAELIARLRSAFGVLSARLRPSDSRERRS